jgi:hypothetical protein
MLLMLLFEGIENGLYASGALGRIDLICMLVSPDFGVHALGVFLSNKISSSR